MLSGPDTPETASNSVSSALKAAAVIHVVLGLGFGLGTVWTLQHLAANGELPITPFGFRSLAGGPFERLPTDQFAALGWTLVGICALDVLAGAWLWHGRRGGAVLGITTSVPALAMSVGFALPFLLAGVPLRVALILAGRRSLQ